MMVFLSLGAAYFGATTTTAWLSLGAPFFGATTTTAWNASLSPTLRQLPISCATKSYRSLTINSVPESQWEAAPSIFTALVSMNETPQRQERAKPLSPKSQGGDPLVRPVMRHFPVFFVSGLSLVCAI